MYVCMCVCIYIYILRILCCFGKTGSPFVDRSTQINICKSQLAAQLSIINYPMHNKYTTDF